MRWLLAAYAAVGTWILSGSIAGALIMMGDRSSLDDSRFILLYLVVTFFWMAFLPILKIAATAARALGITPLEQVLLFYAVVVLLSAGIWGLFCAAAPSPGRDARFNRYSSSCSFRAS